MGLFFGCAVSQYVATNHPERVVAMIQISGQSLYPKRSVFFNILKPFFEVTIKFQSEKSLAKSFAKHKTITPDTLRYLEDGVYHVGKKH